ncbi:MAG: AAA family ATPase, partial [Chloroflexi bacterium]|nr:AAA family ATPase [Chloroflexota bacterium]
MTPAVSTPIGEDEAGSGSPRCRLPAPLSSLIDREDALETIRGLACNRQVRLITLIGPPGVGKTRLALAAAERVSRSFPDGTQFVPLASLRRPNLVLSTVARSLAILQSGRVPLLEVLAQALGDRVLLLVLDNFEHLLPAAPALARLLGSCRGLTVLVTSRTPLHVSGEHLVHVPPLALPTLHPLPTCEDLMRVPSVRLLVERAAAVAPGFRLTPTNASAVAELCVRLDGLPLAIELAAARCRHLDPPQLLSRLDRRFALLSDGLHDAPRRQRTLRDAIDW